LLTLCFLFWNFPLPAAEPVPSFGPLYLEQCAVCHGENLEGTPPGIPLAGRDLVHGSTLDELSTSISNGFPISGMPAWEDVLNEEQIRSLALYIIEERTNITYDTWNIETPLIIPRDVISTQHHDFRLEVIAEGIDPLPFSMEILPDGSFLVTEKTRGLRHISADGQQSVQIQDAPKAYNPEENSRRGLGWLLEVKLDPNYQDNGWIYLQHGDWCDGCNAQSRRLGLAVSMNRIVRGRIRDNRWVDQEVIFGFDIEDYQAKSDIGAGGRIAFDDSGHLFFAIGAKGLDNYVGVQDLTLPWGKLHRINMDGSIPDDNPYIDDPDILDSIWSYGHRSPQGLEINPQTGDLWSTEMGPRGGDEVNFIRPMVNFGWPLHSLGINYNGTEVNYGREALEEEFDIDGIQLPIVDFTPSPAVSSIVFYEGAAFPGWNNDMLMGTMKARTLYRLTTDGDRVINREVLFKDVGRIRDIEIGADGTPFLLMEQDEGSIIVRMSIAD
jgi:glucose/arabinose dehydrogenase|tara:strand:- start:369 stop:1856 length:1488 start_codon:yes stop_codon:yes gene_type:complete